MDLSDIRIKILPARFENGQMRGGEHVLMEPGEEPTGSWIHYERRDIEPGETHLFGHATGVLSERPFPESQTQRVVAIMHYPSGETHEHHFHDAHGVPAEKHPLEDSFTSEPEATVQVSFVDADGKVQTVDPNAPPERL